MFKILTVQKNKANYLVFMLNNWPFIERTIENEMCSSFHLLHLTFTRTGNS
jgi:hypothetical protein